MSALKEVIQIGLDAFGGAGEAINAGLGKSRLSLCNGSAA